LVVYLTDVLSRRVERGAAVRDVLGGVLVVYVLAAALIFKQPDMGTALVVSAIVLGMAEPYRKARLLSFLHPWADRSSTGYQVVQSLVGLGSGGVAGVGLGASRAKWGFLPNAHTDFIFSIVGEELGLVGAVLVVGLFAAFALVGLRAAKK